MQVAVMFKHLVPIRTQPAIECNDSSSSLLWALLYRAEVVWRGVCIINLLGYPRSKNSRLNTLVMTPASFSTAGWYHKQTALARVMKSTISQLNSILPTGCAAEHKDFQIPAALRSPLTTTFQEPFFATRVAKLQACLVLV